MHGLHEAIGQRRRSVDRGVHHDHRQLVAAIAGDQIVNAGGPADDARRLLDHLVAVLVAHRVVHRLEAVDVDQEDR